MTLEVLPYDPNWPMHFTRIRDDLERALVNVPTVSIEHVGSTSVPGLAAKPVIDIDVVVARPHLEDASDALEAVGYVHRGDLGIEDRHSMAPPDEGLRRHVYVVVDGSLALKNHRVIRDALRADPHLARKYGDLKLRLAKSSRDVDTYVEGKTELLVSILANAGFTAADLARIRAANRPRGVSGTSGSRDG